MYWSRLRHLILTGWLLLSGANSTGAAESVDFVKAIQPLLKKHCVSCHGSDKQEGGLRLDLSAAGLKGGDNFAPAIVPGKSADSPLFQFIAKEDADLQMPPRGKRLSAVEIDLIRRWIDAGADWPADSDPVVTDDIQHWSLHPVVRPTHPTGPGITPETAPVDAFLLARLQQSGLTFSNRASRETLIRRLYFVMHGLPPTPDEIADFSHDDAPDAWEKLVDRVLASPRYGERWAQHWLDLVRFGETYGFETNRERTTAWPYRDYVIDAFNSDKPYSQFIREQIAGDALGADVATGFLVAGPYDLVKSQDITLTLMQRQDELNDILSTTATTFLGLTVGCARCHNHKFDPISQKDYYALQAVFAGVQHGERAIPLTPEQTSRLAKLQQREAELQIQLRPFLPRVQVPVVLLDDARRASPENPGVEFLQPLKGLGKHPAGKERGFAQDAGSEERAPNFGRGEYTWWENRPGIDVAAYRPRLTGRFELWAAWGTGYESHTTSAGYWLDLDGDPATRLDQTLLSEVNQQLFADGSRPTVRQPLWSGFKNLGIVSLTDKAAILLRGGKDGTAITGDALLVVPAVDSGTESAPAMVPSLREAMTPRTNVEDLTPTRAKIVRFTILATSGGEPCLDELALFSGEQNVGLASAGAISRCSSELPGYAIHQRAHINDGKIGNNHSWISNEPGTGWIEIELPQAAVIDRIEWGRDQTGQLPDRLATQYRIDVATEPGHWITVATHEDRIPYQNPALAVERVPYRWQGFSAEQVKLGQQAATELQQARNDINTLKATQKVYAGTFQQPGETKRLFRGDPLAPREAVGPDAITVIGSLKLASDAPERERRLALANWIAQPDNPLTARVWVNRIWQFQFGRGLVDTPSDFGKAGIPPTHPELLDWLASELVRNDWSTKKLQRLILLSQVWQQDSRPDPVGLQTDGAGSLLWRFPPRRLEAEAIHDHMLVTSGVLDLTAGGPGYDGFEIQYENVRHYFPKQTFTAADYRRMIYMTKVRMEKEATFGAFDCPDASQVVPRRSLSTTPLQALNLLNSAFVQRQAELLAERLQRDAGKESAQQVQRAYRLCYGRAVEPAEVQAGVDFIAEVGLIQFCRAVLNSNEFLFIP